MKNLLGIGSVGCNMVSQLSKHKNYNCFYISNEYERTTKNKFALKQLNTPEEYEQMDMKKIVPWTNKIKNNVSVFICGASDTSAITLRVLENLHKTGVAISMVYIMPELEVLSENKILLERSVRGILQNYARSGIFEKICMVSNLELEGLAGPTNVYNYYDQINNVFTSTYYMLDVFKNNKPVMSTFKNPKDYCRITTLGVSSLEGEDNLFFPLTDAQEIVYYYGINEKKLKTEENLFRKITNSVKDKITDTRKISFGIYSTEYEEDYIYVEYFSPKIQQIVLDEEQ
tara:strand:+ start:1266 stop:2126 length:861 start_codon:yes stop_codon:yes gene_type:complete